MKKDPSGFVVAIPDADQTPEQLVGLEPGVPKESQYPRKLAQNGFKVLIPTLIALASLVGFIPGMTAYRTDIASSLSD